MTPSASPTSTAEPHLLDVIRWLVTREEEREEEEGVMTEAGEDEEIYMH